MLMLLLFPRKTVHHWQIQLLGVQR
jgi:hypothetical protein